MPASATGSAARPKPKRVFVTLLFTLAVTYGVTLAVTRDSPDSAAVGTCAPMAGRGKRDRRRTGTECGGRRRERLRCDVRGACGLPGAHGKVRSAHTKVWQFFGGGCRPRLSNPGGHPLSPLDS